MTDSTGRRFPLLLVPDLERPVMPSELMAPDRKTIRTRTALLTVAVFALAIVLVRLGTERQGGGEPSPATLQPPVVESIRPVSSGGISFIWSDPNDGTGYVPAFQLFEDGVRLGGTTEMRLDPNGVPLREQFVTHVTVSGRRHRVDATRHTYCVVVRLVSGPDPADSAEACIRD
jgi:hypothetical protein